MHQASELILLIVKIKVALVACTWNGTLLSLICLPKENNGEKMQFKIYFFKKNGGQRKKRERAIASTKLKGFTSNK